MYELPTPGGYLRMPACVERLAHHLAPALGSEAITALFEAAPAISLLHEAKQLATRKAVLLIEPSLATWPKRLLRTRAEALAEAAAIVKPKLTAQQVKAVRRNDQAQDQFRPVRDQAAQHILRYLGDGALTAYLLCEDDGTLEAMPPALWRTRPALAAIRDGRWPNDKGEYYRTGAGVVLVREADLVRLLSAQALTIPDEPPTATKAPEPAGSSAAPLPGTPARYSQAALEKWYRERVANWPPGQRIPSLAQDWADVKAVPGLEAVSRRPLEALRKLWPEKSRLGGRPPTRGV